MKVACLFFNTFLTLDTAAGYTRDDLFRQEDVKQEGGQEHDDDSCEESTILTCVLH